VTSQYVPNLGQLCSEEDRRDCIHMAVAPVVAGCPLDPGDHVSLEDGVAVKPNFGRRGTSTIGVVDPFLDSVVCSGEQACPASHPT
jgi:hypothetical protein